MVKHIILWKIKDEIKDKNKIKEDVKDSLEGLMGKIPGLLDICVEIMPLSTSTADIMLDSSFQDEESLKTYAIHPEHVKVADKYVRRFMGLRMCMDYGK